MNVLYKLCLVAAIVLTLDQQAAATLLIPLGLHSASAQATFADLAIASAADDLGVDSGYLVTYTGLTDSRLWSGSLAGDFLGLAVDGSLSGDISGPDPTDPVINLSSGDLRIGGTPYALSGSFTTNENLKVTAMNFKMTTTVGGVTRSIIWKNDGELTAVVKPDGTIDLSGNVLETTTAGEFGAALGIKFIPDPKDPNVFKIQSALVKKLRPALDSGKVTLTTATSFDGAIDLIIEPASVPQPTTLALLIVGAVALVLARCLGGARKGGARGRSAAGMDSSSRDSRRLAASPPRAAA